MVSYPGKFTGDLRIENHSRVDGNGDRESGEDMMDGGGVGRAGGAERSKTK